MKQAAKDNKKDNLNIWWMQDQILEVVKMVLQEHVSKRIMEQIMGVLAPLTAEANRGGSSASGVQPRTRRGADRGSPCAAEDRHSLLRCSLCHRSASTDVEQMVVFLVPQVVGERERERVEMVQSSLGHRRCHVSGRGRTGRCSWGEAYS